MAGRPGQRGLRLQEAAKEIEASSAGLPPETRELVRKFTESYIEKLTELVEDKIKDGALKELSIKELTKELRGLLNAVKGPSTTLTNINLPDASQIPTPIPARLPPDNKKQEAIETTFEDAADAEEEDED